MAAGGEVLWAMDDRAGVAVAEVTLARARPASTTACEGERIPELTRYDWTRKN